MNKFAQLGADIAKLWVKFGGSYLGGIKNTLILALVGTVIGCLIGFICGVLNTIPYNKNDNPVKRFFLTLIRVIIRVYVEVFRGTPMVLQAVFLYYGLPYFTNNSVKFSSVWMAAIVVVSINTGAYMAETVRGGIGSIDVGQREGALSMGMSPMKTMLYVVLPQAFQNVMPEMANTFLTNLKMTSVLNVIAVQELFMAAKTVGGNYYKYFESYLVIAVIYFVLCFAFNQVFLLVERHMRDTDDYALAVEYLEGD
jgi:putative lysine transport system permease protein